MFTSRSGRCDFSPSNTRSRVGNTEILPQDVDCFFGKWRRWIWFFKSSSCPPIQPHWSWFSTFFSCVFCFSAMIFFEKSRNTCALMRVIGVSCRSVGGVHKAPLRKTGAYEAPPRNVSGVFGTPPMHVISCRCWLVKTLQNSTLRHPA